MRLTNRDRSLIRDVALSHVLSRDQIVNLGYFTSISRANVRLKQLVEAGFLKPHLTPFHRQHLYAAGQKVVAVVGQRISEVICGRRPSPQFLQHSLAVTNVRIALAARGMTAWRFEPQVRHSVTFKGRTYDVRPDGLAIFDEQFTFIEADLGHVCRAKFAEKLRSYSVYGSSGTFTKTYGDRPFEVLTVTTGTLRKANLSCLVNGSAMFRFQTFEELGSSAPGGWQ